jgi:hypothetical protein
MKSFKETRHKEVVVLFTQTEIEILNQACEGQARSPLLRNLGLGWAKPLRSPRATVRANAAMKESLSQKIK